MFLTHIDILEKTNRIRWIFDDFFKSGLNQFKLESIYPNYTEMIQDITGDVGICSDIVLDHMIDNDKDLFLVSS